MAAESTTLHLEPGTDFVVTPFIERLCQRCLDYLELGYAVHLSGPAGTGKTTIAMHLASLLGRPVMLIYGDEEFGSSDLLGGEKGLVSKRLVDNYVRSVLKTEESVRSVWVDQRLTTACREGYTLIYDEFSRSHAEANNVLLSVLEEKLLALPEGRYGETYIHVHPKFRAIFTSNPDEYAGVYTPPSALMDRLITIRLDAYDAETEVAITTAKSGLPKENAQKIVELVRKVREGADGIRMPTIRAAIMIGRILERRGGKIHPDDEIFMETCLDVLIAGSDRDGQIQEIIEETLGSKSPLELAGVEDVPLIKDALAPLFPKATAEPAV
jgi:nitric oxide reductase NorQ protein